GGWVGRRRRLGPRIALAAAVAVAAAAAAAIFLPGGPAAPTVAEAARLATQAPTGPAPSSAGKPGTRLALALEGVSFPDLKGFAGWRAEGSRRTRIDGRDATVVFYRKDGRRIGYVIVGGTSLARPRETQTRIIRGVEYQ